MLAETFIIIGVMFVAVMGPSIVIGILGHAAILALARNPSAAPKILWGMSILVIFVVAISVIAMLILFQSLAK